jgi:hypothetical protein
MTNIEKDSAQPQYWVVGAMLAANAAGDMYKIFVKRGYWDYGYDPDYCNSGNPNHAQYSTTRSIPARQRSETKLRQGIGSRSRRCLARVLKKSVFEPSASLKKTTNLKGVSTLTGF